MVLFLTVAVLISATGMVLVLVLKSYEMRTGRLFLGSLRPPVARSLHNSVLFIEYILPGLARRGVRGAWLAARAVLKAGAARAILFFEAALERMLSIIRDAMQPPRGGGQASQFLRDVAEHKRQLLERPANKRAIFDDQ